MMDESIKTEELFCWKPEIPHSFYVINPWHSTLMALTALSLYFLPLIAAYFLLKLNMSVLLKLVICVLAGLIVAAGNMLLAIFTHEASHYSLFKQRKLNLVAGILCLSVTPSAFLSCMRFFELHAQHHKYIHTINDPEDIFIPHIHQPLTMHLIGLGMKNTIIYLFRYSFYSIKNLLIENDPHHFYKHLLFIIECLFYFTCLGLQLYFMWLLPWLILVYLIANLTALFMIVIIAHASHDFNFGLNIKNQKIAKWIAKFILKSSFGTFLHLEHHAFPTVPAYHLPHLCHFLFLEGFYKKNNIRLGSVHLQIAEGKI